MSEQNQQAENKVYTVKKKSKSKRFLIFIIIILFLWIFNCYTIRTNKYEVETSKVNNSVRIASNKRPSCFFMEHKKQPYRKSYQRY